MANFKYGLTINQGETLEKKFTWKAGNPAQPVDLSDVTDARMQVRTSAASSTVLLELSKTAGSIVVGTSSGEITLSLTAAQTSAITWRSALYDLEITFQGGRVVRLLQGCINVTPEITRD